MRRRVLVVLAALCLSVSLVGCGGDGGEDDDGSRLPPEPGVAPTKAHVIDLLTDFLDALEQKDYDAAAAFLVPALAKDKAKTRKRLAGLIRKREIGRDGIEVLAERGRFGPLADVVPENGEAWARKRGVDPAQCHALRTGAAVVAVFWGGETLQILRIDDIGKLN